MRKALLLALALSLLATPISAQTDNGENQGIGATVSDFFMSVGETVSQGFSGGAPDFVSDGLTVIKNATVDQASQGLDTAVDAVSGDRGSDNADTGKENAGDNWPF